MSSPPPPARTRPAARRDELLDAASELFRAQGISATTVADVTARAGVAKGTFYLYFESRAHLVAALQGRQADGLIAAILAAVEEADPDGDYWAMVDDAVERAVGYLVDNKDVFGNIQAADWAEAADIVAAQDQRCVEAIEVAIRLGIERGEVVVTDPALIAQMVYHGIHGAVHHVLIDGERPDVDRDHLVAVVREAVSRLLRPV